MKLKTLIFFYFILNLVACQKDNFETNQRDLGKKYINYLPKTYSIFKVEQIVFNDFTNQTDTNHFEVLDINDSFILDNLNENIMRIERYKRNDSSEAWAFSDVYYSKLDDLSYSTFEINKKTIKISFPLSEDAYWNINAFNTDIATMVYYDKINNSMTLDNKTYNNVLVVKSDVVNNSIREKQYQEIYAENIGLIEALYVQIEKNQNKLRGQKTKYQLIKHVR